MCVCVCVCRRRRPSLTHTLCFVGGAPATGLLWGLGLTLTITLPICKAYPIEILFQGHCATYALRSPTDPPFVCQKPYHIGDGNIV